MNLLIEPFIPFDYTSIGLKYENIQLIYGPLMMHMINRDDFLNRFHSTDTAKFKKIDFIVLSKKSIYFDRKKISNRIDSLNYKQSNIIIDKLNSGKIGYLPYQSNPYY